MFDRFSHKSRGSILVISTLMLAMLAGLSIGTLQNVVTEYQLSTQDADKTLALESAQYALSEAKRLILTDWSPGAPTCPTVSPCNPNNSNGIAVWSYNAFKGYSDFSKQPVSFFSTNAQPTAAKPLASLAAAPRFFVIDLGCDVYSKANIYRILAMGYGNSINSVAYAESQLTMPLSGQNSYANAPTTPLVGVAVQTSNAAPVSLPVNQQAYNLALSTNSRNLFFHNGGGSCSNPGQSGSTGATCEMNCLGQVRVKGFSAYNGTGCPWIYGDWVPATNQSVLQLNNGTPASAANTMTLSCGPCQIAMTVPTNVCNSGQYNSCTGSCVIACTGGQVWNGNACVCLSNQTWSGTACQCNAGYQQTGGNVQTGFVCSACPTGTYSGAASACAPCPAGTFSGSVAQNFLGMIFFIPSPAASSCTPCPAGFSSNAGAGTCTACSGGTYSGAGSASCTTCPANTWSYAAGTAYGSPYQQPNTQCFPCPPGMSSPPGTTGIASDRNNCQCPAGQIPIWNADANNGHGSLTCIPWSSQYSSPCPAGQLPIGNGEGVITCAPG